MRIGSILGSCLQGCWHRGTPRRMEWCPMEDLDRDEITLKIQGARRANLESWDLDEGVGIVQAPLV
jgi:hypothetical protein